MLENAGKGSSADSCSELEGGNNDRDWLLLLLISLLKTGDWLLPVLWMGLGVQSSTGCFFWTSAKHLEHKFIVLLDPQNPQGHLGGRVGGLLRSLVSPMTSNTHTHKHRHPHAPTHTRTHKKPIRKREAGDESGAWSFNEKKPPTLKLHKTIAVQFPRKSTNGQKINKYRVGKLASATKSLPLSQRKRLSLN